MILMHDITDSVNIIKIKEVSTFKDKFMKSVSHELRTVVTYISNSL